MKRHHAELPNTAPHASATMAAMRIAHGASARNMSSRFNALALRLRVSSSVRAMARSVRVRVMASPWLWANAAKGCFIRTALESFQNAPGCVARAHNGYWLAPHGSARYNQSWLNRAKKSRADWTVYMLALYGRDNDTERELLSIYQSQYGGTLYLDSGESRDKLNEVTLLIMAGEVNRLVICRLSVLGKTLSQLNEFIGKLEDGPCSLVSIYEGLDTLTPQGRYASKLIDGLVKAESEVRSVLMKEVISKSEHYGEGKWGGRPKGTPDKTLPEVRARIIEMFNARMPITEIAQRMNLARQTIYTVLKEEGVK